MATATVNIFCQNKNGPHAKGTRTSRPVFKWLVWVIWGNLSHSPISRILNFHSTNKIYNCYITVKQSSVWKSYINYTWHYPVWPAIWILNVVIQPNDIIINLNWTLMLLYHTTIFIHPTIIYTRLSVQGHRTISVWISQTAKQIKWCTHLRFIRT